MSCKAGGNPPPEVHWTKEGGGLVSQGQTVMAGSGLVLSSVSREDEGLYLCTASNGVGAPASPAPVPHGAVEVRSEPWAPQARGAVHGRT